MALDLPPLSLQDVERLYEKPAHVRVLDAAAKTPPTNSADAVQVVKAGKNEAAKSRAQALLDTGLSVGIKTGMAWQITNVTRAVTRRERDLDTLYNFNFLMIHDRVVPPVITEARDLYNQDGDLALRLSGALYKIESQARFSSVAPTWRDYLTFPAPMLDMPTLASSLAPRDAQEREVWRLAVNDGWRQGVTQANLVFTEAFDRMNRDLAGMLRFHTFVIEGKITMPAIASEAIPVSQAGRTLSVDETLLRITTLPEFDNRLNQWRGFATQSPYAVPTIPMVLSGSNELVPAPTSEPQRQPPVTRRGSR